MANAQSTRHDRPVLPPPVIAEDEGLVDVEVASPPEDVLPPTKDIAPPTESDGLVNIEIVMGDDFEIATGHVEGDDCEVFVDDDDDDDDLDIEIEVDGENEVNGDEDGNNAEEVPNGSSFEKEAPNASVFQEEEVSGRGIEEEECSDLVSYYDNTRMSDDEEGDDMWNEDLIPDPLDPEDDEDEYERREEAANDASCEELLWLGKTFNCAADFKVALL